MGPAGFLIADDGEIGMRNQAGLAAELPEALAPTWQSRLGSAGAMLIGLAFLAAALAGKRRV